jgi:hypothetical protein
MLAGKVVPAFDRRWLALVLTVQVFVGACVVFRCAPSSVVICRRQVR